MSDDVWRHISRSIDQIKWTGEHNNDGCLYIAI